jgi:hypothetical protein
MNLNNSSTYNVNNNNSTSNNTHKKNNRLSNVNLNSAFESM